MPLLYSPSHFPSLSRSFLVSSANCLSSLMPKQATATRTLPTPIKQLSRLLRPNVKKNTPFHTLLLSLSLFLSLTFCYPCYVQEKQLPNFSCFFTAKEKLTTSYAAIAQLAWPPCLEHWMRSTLNWNLCTSRIKRGYCSLVTTCARKILYIKSTSYVCISYKWK